MKKSRLLIWAAVLVLCTACYVLLGKKSSSAETTDSEETDEETVLAVRRTPSQDFPLWWEKIRTVF